MSGQIVVLDTGPIRELITYRAVHDLGFASLRAQLQFFSAPSAYSKFTKFLSSYRRKVTSPSVVVELYHWIRKTDRTGHNRLWSLVHDEFKGMGMEEDLVTLLEMPLDLVARCGPADISLLILAQRHLPSQPMVVTIEAELAAECFRARINAIQIQEILTQV
ncbi:MAG TPA: hypothetical protein VNW97_06730 [Candidatus Saccharimonadales bacterium]|jgi:hypothetical protein|nr:hypothetical protein [Candidatus Saccharimonadales bacterium]